MHLSVAALVSPAALQEVLVLEVLNCSSLFPVAYDNHVCMLCSIGGVVLLAESSY